MNINYAIFSKVKTNSCIGNLNYLKK